MILWIAIAALTAAALGALLAPLFRAGESRSDSESELAIYRDQLEEIDRDVGRGVLPEGEAGPARTEIARRLLHASETEGRSVADQPRRRRGALVFALVLVPVIGVAGYLSLGSPDAGDRPFSARLSDPADDDLFARLDAFFAQPTSEAIVGLEVLIEAALAETPDNGRILEAASLVYLGARRYEDAIATYDRYIAIVGTGGDPGGGLAMLIGQTIILAEGAVTPVAEAAFLRALILDPTNPTARLSLAVAMKERGETDGAAAAFLALLADEPPGGTDWGDFARAELQDLGVEAPPPAEAADLTDGFTAEQMEMINVMVNGLAAQLAETPEDVDGWVQLIRSYIVLGRETDARDAAAAARAVFTGNADALAAIEDVAAPIMRVDE
ncbi:MAG: c-type cytochrome biogenesis protein CcmI [Alphaproteobacteria bacterium]